MLRTAWLIGLVLAGMGGLLLLVAGPRSAQAKEGSSGSTRAGIAPALIYTSHTKTTVPGGPGSPVPDTIRVSSAYTTGGILFDGKLVFDHNPNTGWISDPAQPPEGQWIEWDTPAEAQLDEIWLNVYVSAMRYSRPQTSTLTAADGATQVLSWENTSQTQPLKLATPVTGRVRLTIDTIWGGSQTKQPIGIADLTLFMSRVRRAATAVPPTTPNPLPTAPPITGPTSTAPDTVLVTTTTTLFPPGNGTDPWRWWLVGVLVLIAGFFLLRGLRRQRGR